jgi:tetratricopeptide (TPR) repeat protein
MFYGGSSGTILAIAFTSIVGGCALLVTGTSDSGIGFIFFGAMYLFSYYWYGRIPEAWRAMNEGNLEEAELYVDSIEHPERLRKSSKSYYYWICGVLAREKGDAAIAREHFSKALSLGPRSKNDRSMLLLHLAALEYSMGNADAAHQHFSAAKSLPVNKKTADLIRKIEAQVEGTAA